jgi:NAD(P)-dependent dehydrogenase (short-subunit alcohol dehydrogenase family)
VKRVVVTRGIGFGMAREFLRDGRRVFVCGRKLAWRLAASPFRTRDPFAKKPE